MKTAIIVANQSGHQMGFGDAFFDGLVKHGWKARISKSYAESDLLVIWGVRNRTAIENQIRIGGEICILERGYIGNRFEWTSVSFGGGLNGRGRYYGPFADASRWKKHFWQLMKPWAPKAEGYGLILGQVIGDMSLKGVDIAQKWQSWAAGLRRLGIKPAFREHPQNRVFAMGVPVLPRDHSLAEDLEQAALAVTWNSNSAVDAVLAGIPAIAMDEGSMAWEVTGHQLKPPPMPEREAWAHALAWKQWRIEEMRSGYCWEMAGLRP